MAVIGLRGVPDVMGGIETHCSELLPRILSEVAPGELEIVVLARKSYVSAAGEHDGVRQIPLWAPRRAALETIVHTLVALLYARFVLRADLVHLHAIGPGLLTPLARLLGFRVIFTHHGEDYRRKKWGRFSKAALRAGEVLALTFAHRILAVSRGSADRLRARFPSSADRIVHVPNGFTRAAGPARQEDGAPASYGVTPGRYVLTVGRLVPEKGQDLLVEAFLRSGLAAQEPPWHLLVVGDADHDSSYARSVVAQAGRHPGVVLAGRVPRARVLSLNRQAALFVLPSYHEGLSIAVLEAISAGVPVLLSDIEANRNIGLPEANFFRCGSVEHLAEKLDAPLETYAVGRDFDLSAFDWSRIARQTIEQIDALGESGPLPRAACEA